MSYNSKYTGEQVEGFLDQIANGEISGGSSVYKWNWNSEMNGTFTEEEFEKLSNADVVYITTGVADMEMLYSVDGRAVVEDALHLGVHILSFETDTDNSEAANVESITFIFDNASKTWSAQGGNSELITNEQLTSALEDKQDKITDLDAIRSGADKGATALQSVPSEYVTETELTNKGYATTSDLDKKVDKISGKQLSTEDFTTALKTKLEGLSNYDDTELSEALSTLRGDFDKLVSGDTTTAIKTFNEVIAFLDGIQDSQDLSSIIASIEQQIAGKMDKVTLATVATSGSYNDLSNKPTIPTALSQLNNDVEYITHEDVAAVARTGSYNDLEDKPTIPVAVTESTVSGWGFTKNTGTYSKPSGGIPKSDLDSATQQVLTTAFGDHQTIEDMSIDISDLKDEMSNTAVTQQYGEDKVAKDIDGFITRRQTVYALPDAAGGAEDDVIATANTLKTINGQSILGSGDITIEVGSKVYELDLTGRGNFEGYITEEEWNIIKTSDRIKIITDTFSTEIVQIYSPLFKLIGDFTIFSSAIGIQGGAATSCAFTGANITEGFPYSYQISELFIPTKTSQLDNDSNFITSDNLKTINGESILGEGDIAISGGVSKIYVDEAIASAITTTLNTAV